MSGCITRQAHTSKRHIYLFIYSRKTGTHDSGKRRESRLDPNHVPKRDTFLSWTRGSVFDPLLLNPTEIDRSSTMLNEHPKHSSFAIQISRFPLPFHHNLNFGLFLCFQPLLCIIHKLHQKCVMRASRRHSVVKNIQLQPLMWQYTSILGLNMHRYQPVSASQNSLPRILQSLMPRTTGK